MARGCGDRSLNGLRSQYDASDDVRQTWHRLFWVPVMDAYDLLESHQYADAIREYRQRLKDNPEDWGAVAGLGCALRAAGAYAEALSLLHRVDEYERASLPGSPGQKRD